MLTCAARFWRYDRRSKAWLPTDAPDKVAETYLARRGRWKLPVLAGIIHTPFLRADGSICEAPGYDQASGLLFKSEGETFPPIPQQPTKADAVAALGLLEELIGTFPFVTEADRSVALSAILTTLDRRSMATAPLHGFSSPAAGTGKSLLVDVCATLATGRLNMVAAKRARSTSAPWKSSSGRRSRRHHAAARRAPSTSGRCRSFIAPSASCQRQSAARSLRSITWTR